MIPVESKSINAVEHNNMLAALKVEFKNGNVYLYPKVSREQYQAFMAAESKGTYLNEHFRGKGKRVFQ